MSGPRISLEQECDGEHEYGVSCPQCSPWKEVSNDPQSAVAAKPYELPKSLRKNCTLHIYKDQKSEWRWSLIAPNRKIVANSSDGYSSEQACREAFGLIEAASNSPLV